MPDYTTPGGGKALGKLPPKNAPAIKFATIRDRVVPQYPPSFDAIETLNGWKMLGNDSAGVCVSVTLASQRRVANFLIGRDSYFSLDQVVQFYKTQNPGFVWGSPVHGAGSNDDRGMEIQTALETLHKKGGPDGVKAVAFAKVDHTNVDEMKAALAAFWMIWLGVIVTDDNEREFPRAAWTRSGQALGGHSIMGHKYTLSLFGMQTWADKGLMSLDYVLKGNDNVGVEEAWVVLWPEQAALLDQAGRDAMDEAYAAVTNGKHIDWTGIPLPGPVDPTPTPPEPADPGLPEEVLVWLESLPRYYRKVWTSLKNYLESKGLI